MKPYYEHEDVYLYHGDCNTVLPALPANSIDTCITDPPYGISFMKAKWDYNVPGVDTWRAVLRVLKPGAILLSFGGARTFHRLTCAIEDAGFEIRDCIMWVYGQGFARNRKNIHLPKGWGISLKPAWDPIIVAMKPREGTFANNAQTWGVTGFNIGECGVPTNVMDEESTNKKKFRLPANLIHDGSEEVVSLFPQVRSGKCFNGFQGAYKAHVYGEYKHNLINPANVYSDAGSAARFFYCARASTSERDLGMPPHLRNTHPTVKPLALIRYLALLTKTPTNGIVLDPFMGSGTIGMSAILEGRGFVGIEINKKFCKTARHRINWVIKRPKQLQLPSPSLTDNRNSSTTIKQEPLHTDKYLPLFAITK